jgi:hypothetical protein
MSEKKKIVKTEADLSKVKLTGWGMARKVAEAIKDRKKKNDMEIKKGGG